MQSTIPIIDLFAGPGGLGEGFSRFRVADHPGRRPFTIVKSIEKDPWAHRTLELRSFYRQFTDGSVPDAYYQYLRGEISHEKLFATFPEQARAARSEALLKELGVSNESEVFSSIDSALKSMTGSDHCVLIGGPPCQAYSLIGRSRMGERGDSKNDNRHFLYLEYLKIIVQFRPSVFVMENVKGLLSSKIGDGSMFERILSDLRNPALALDDKERLGGLFASEGEPLCYKIYSLVSSTDSPDQLEPRDFVVKCEKYAIPQARHRIILIGVRSGLTARPKSLQPYGCMVPARDVIADLPRLRSRLSPRGTAICDSSGNWKKAMCTSLSQPWITEPEWLLTPDLRSIAVLNRITSVVPDLNPILPTGAEFVPCKCAPVYRPDWYTSSKLSGACNHVSRSHIPEDLYRYLFSACYAEKYGCSPKMRDYPADLLPAHNNVLRGADRSGQQDFEDRFRVQVADRPATTITAHISKDGHYHIHYDPAQCRSLTVREAARLQTFPDDYFFEGPRTEQYRQVGNAVPPLLAYQIAEIIYNMLDGLLATQP